MATWRAQSEKWDNVSQAYESDVVKFTELFARDLVEAVDLSAQDRVIDLAAGTGAASLLAAGRCKNVDCNDFSNDMLSILKEKADKMGIQNISVLHADGTQLPVDDCVYEVAISNFGVIFFPDFPAGLREMYRVLVPGGRVGVCTWAPPQRVPAFNVFSGTLEKCFPGKSANKGRVDVDEPMLEAALQTSGFDDVRVLTVSYDLVMPSAQAYWDRMANGSPGSIKLLESLTSEERDTFHRAVLENLHEKFPSGDVRMPAEALLALGTKGS
ncbi:hypothetical protein CYMTET_31569 [Cymbomonas tetramitiformis]|uniref:Uncharacterized protein n=1 Tax=Cymbomonas tetramitiformis TaxID=36881 RepID=A0AAE0FGS9_9CHLO|nr:hypothetical protein CYMTET_31569 [Cymbomonas tetramitiformis]